MMNKVVFFFFNLCSWYRELGILTKGYFKAGVHMNAIFFAT